MYVALKNVMHHIFQENNFFPKDNLKAKKESVNDWFLRSLREVARKILGKKRIELYYMMNYCPYDATDPNDLWVANNP